MKIIASNEDKNIIINAEDYFQSNAGWQESLQEFENEILNDIVNPIENYETVRYIHSSYSCPPEDVTQTDIWFYFYFLDNNGRYDNGLDYSLVDITVLENAKMLKQSTKSFFRLEFFKTPLKTWRADFTYNTGDVVYYVASTTNGNITTYTGNTYTSTIGSNINNNPQTGVGWSLTNTNTILCEPPTRQNRRLVFAKNLSLPLGEKYYYTPINEDIFVPVFTGSNYRNKENMYLFWFQDESVLEETNLSGSTTGNTFFMTAKFYNAKTGDILDFTNSALPSSTEIEESRDMYYQVDFDKTNHSYKIYPYNGLPSTTRAGTRCSTIKFYQTGGQVPSTPTPTPTLTTTSTPTPTPTPSLGSILPTPTPSFIPLELNSYYITIPLSINDTDFSGCADIFDYCIDNSYIMNQLVYSQAPTKELLEGYTIFNSDGVTPFVGTSDINLRYPITEINGIDTTTGNYNLINIDLNGVVQTRHLNPCICHEGRGGGDSFREIN